MDSEKLEKARSRLLAEIEQEARATRNFTGRAAFAPAVMAAMAAVPRHAFVLDDDVPAAYVNRPLPIGHGQTISQPYMVACMTDLLDLGPDDRVLEIGTGCGYQAAVLAEVAGRVYSVEAVKALADSARARLWRLGYGNVEVRHGDGCDGWAEEAPFDAIMVTAAARAIPDALVEQLKPGGRMVIPVGPVHGHQTLYICIRESGGGIRKTPSLPVAFVPLVPGGGEGRP